MLLSYVCPVCGKEFTAYQRRTTCSRKCLTIYQQDRLSEPCSSCGKKITDLRSRFKRARRVFCDIECAHQWQSKHRVKFPQLRDKKWCLSQYKKRSLKKIADYLGCGETVVYKYFKIHGINLDRSKWIRGDKHYLWKNGITPLCRAIRTSQKNQLWRKAVWESNRHECALCGSVKNLEIDHIKKFKFILKDNNIQSLDDAYSCTELWDVNNGRILCGKCNRVDVILSHLDS